VQKEHVLIVGAGAVGMLFGHYLTQVGIRVTFVTRGREQSGQIRDQGCILIDLKGCQHTIKPKTVAFEDETAGTVAGHDDVAAVLVTVKQPQLPQVLDWLQASLADSIPVIFLMNGMGHLERVQDALPNPVYYAITQCGATRRAGHLVEEKGRGVTRIGSAETGQTGEQDDRQRIAWLLQAFSAYGHALQWSSRIEVEMLRKCVINACINPLTALFQVQNGQLVHNPNLNVLMQYLYAELEALYAGRQRMQKDVFQQGLLWEEIEKVCRITSQNQSSMLQDILNKRKTEIEAINGYFLSVAQQKAVSLPCHQFVFTAIKALEQAYPGAD
jgi:2-dehydropantoate 2-reductase